MGFGGAIKLTGASEYQRELTHIKQNLQEVSSQMQVVASKFDANDRSAQALVARYHALNDVLETQKTRLATLKSQYDYMLPKYEEQARNHADLLKTYEEEKKKLLEIEDALGETSKEYAEQSDKVNDLTKQVKDSTNAMDYNDKKMSELVVEMNKAEAECNNTERAVKSLGEQAKQAGAEGFTILKGAISDLASKAIQSAITAMKKLGNEIVNIGKQAYGNYASYQQLVGGVETLFKESAGIVKEYAQNAYKEAGISANQYMDQVTSFSASLLQGLDGDTAKTAEYANRAINDMADNANKMGTSIQSIQNAYQGFAKQNYTMLDNLKLGYGGTKKEMERLISDTSKMTEWQEKLGVTVEEGKMSFDNMINAIHVYQAYLGYAGTTALEAEKTISGSAYAMQSAWQNLLTAIADPDQDVGKLINDFVESAITAGRNAIPRYLEIARGMVDVARSVWEELIPQLREQIPELDPLIDALQWIKDNGPTIVSIVGALVAGMSAFKVYATVAPIVEAFKALFVLLGDGVGIMEALNVVMSANPVGLIIAGVTALVAGIVLLWNTSDRFREWCINAWESIKEVFNGAVEGLDRFFTETIPTAFNEAKESVSLWITSVIEWFSQLPDKIKGFVEDMVTGVVTFFNELPYKIGYILGTVAGNVATWGHNVREWILENVPKMIEAIVKFFSELPSKVWAWLVDTYHKVVDWGAQTVEKAIEVGRNFIARTIEFFSQLPNAVWTWLVDTYNRVVTFTVNMVQKAKEGAINVFNAIVDKLKQLPSQIWSIGRDVVSGIWEGISSMGSWLWNKITNFASGILDGFRSAFKIGSPSKVMADEVGEYLAEGIGVGFTEGMADVARDMKNAVPSSFDIDPTVNGQRYESVGADLTLISAFKEALSQMKIELDDEVAGRFVEQTVANAIYA